MSKFKSALKTLGSVATSIADHENAVNDMTAELLKRSYGVDPAEARKIARTLVSHAEVTWK